MIRIASLLLCLALAACSGKPPTQPVPIGDRAALEQLAAQYDKLAERIPVSPHRLSPSERKDFVTKVFAAAGYSYSATLHRLAQGGWDTNDQNAKDLVDLLFMPHTDLRPEDSLSGVYSQQELADLRKVQRMLPQ
jgi:hypothetical protein